MLFAFKPAPFLLLALLAACDGAPPPPQAPLLPVPPEACAKVKEALDTLQGQGALVYTDKGEATIDQQGWLAMGAGPREQLATALGLHAACSQSTPTAEQTVTVRSETGTTLMQRVIETQTDIGQLLGEVGS
jgi:hypothetical protein